MLFTVFKEKIGIADSKKMESEYTNYIPGKCAYCGSPNDSEILKKKLKGEVIDGYL